MNPLFFALEILCPVASESNLNRVFFQCRYLCNKSFQSLIFCFFYWARVTCTNGLAILKWDLSWLHVSA